MHDPDQYDDPQDFTEFTFKELLALALIALGVIIAVITLLVWYVMQV